MLPYRWSPALAAMMHVLADGEWHPRDELIRAGAAHVDPAAAWRRRETMRARFEACRTERRPSGRRIGQQPITVHEAQQIGSRDMARDVLEKATKRGAVERQGDLCRATPQLMECLSTQETPA